MSLTRFLTCKCLIPCFRKRCRREGMDSSKADEVSTRFPCSGNGDGKMDFNIYATRKTVAQGMMDIALFTSNASQLKYLLIHGIDDQHFVISVTLVGISLTMQIIVGVLLIFLGRFNLNALKEQRKADFLNNVVIVIVFLITVVNVLISAFGSGAPDPDASSGDTQWRIYGSKEKNRYERSAFLIPPAANCSGQDLLGHQSAISDLLFI